MNMFVGWSRGIALALIGSLLPLMSFGADFEIPLSELAKVKKKAPAKTAAPKKSKKSGKSGEHKAAPGVEEQVVVKEPAAAKEPVVAKDAAQPSQAVTEAGRIVLEAQPAAKTEDRKAPDVPPAPASQAATAPSAAAAPPIAVPAVQVRPAVADASIIHDPNSYIVTGKRTVILAIVSSSGEPRSVQCHFRAAADGNSASTPMVKVPGTRFTYSALVPALAGNAGALRYSFTVTDGQDRTVRSKEYVVPVKASAVVPGWQLDNFQDKLRVSAESSGRMPEGFQDAGLNK